MPAILPVIHVLSAPLLIFDNPLKLTKHRCLRCFASFRFRPGHGNLTGRYIVVHGIVDAMRNIPDCSVWTPEDGGVAVPVGNHCEAVDNVSRNDPREEAYIVETDMPACAGCGLGARYSVVGPDPKGSGDIAESTIYERQEDADDLAEAMNRAYRAGVRMLMRNMSTEALDEMRDFAAAR